MSKSIQIFKPGKHTAMSGAALEFSESDLVASAKAYDPALHEAPIVVGHPQGDAPAYGWIKSLSYAEGLQAQTQQVDPAFAEMVTAGRFKKVSASFYTPDSPTNPVPGVYYLRHVGFLGAQPPAVKGLRQAEFADAEQGIVEFGDWDTSLTASLLRSLKNFLIGKYGQDAIEQALPEWNVQALSDSAAQSDDQLGAGLSYADPENPGENEMTPDQKAEFEKLQKSNLELTTANKNLTDAAASFAEAEK